MQQGPAGAEARAQKWLRESQQARARPPKPSPPALNCICRASRMHQCSVHVSEKEGRGPSGSQREGNWAIGCPLHSPPCTLLPPNQGPTLGAHGRHSSTPGLVRGQSSDEGGRRWRCGKPSISPLALGGALPSTTLLPPRTPAHSPTTATQGRSPGQQGAGWGLLQAAHTPQPDSCGLSAPLRRPGRSHTAPPPTPLPTWCWGSKRAPTGVTAPQNEGARRLRWRSWLGNPIQSTFATPAWVLYPLPPSI